MNRASLRRIEKHLVLNKYLPSLFGMSDFRDLSDFGSVAQEKFGITHMTLQMECSACGQYPVCHLGE